MNTNLLKSCRACGPVLLYATSTNRYNFDPSSKSTRWLSSTDSRIRFCTKIWQRFLSCARDTVCLKSGWPVTKSCRTVIASDPWKQFSYDFIFQRRRFTTTLPLKWFTISFHIAVALNFSLRNVARYSWLESRCVSILVTSLLPETVFQERRFDLSLAAAEAISV